MNKKGFTLIEVLVALAILGIILVSLIHGTSVVIRHNAYLEHRKIAMELAQRLINNLVSLPYDCSLLRDTQADLTFINNIDPDPNNNTQVYLLDNGNGNYDGGADVKDANDAANGIDHPNTNISAETYSDISPIEKIGPKVYYKIWGIKSFANMKQIVVVVYWFESDREEPHFLTLNTFKRST